MSHCTSGVKRLRSDEQPSNNAVGTSISSGARYKIKGILDTSGEKMGFVNYISLCCASVVKRLFPNLFWPPAVSKSQFCSPKGMLFVSLYSLSRRPLRNAPTITNTNTGFQKCRGNSGLLQSQWMPLPSNKGILCSITRIHVGCPICSLLGIF